MFQTSHMSHYQISIISMASDAWLSMIHSGDNSEKDLLRKGLLEYCNLDSLAMVMILEKMRELVNEI